MKTQHSVPTTLWIAIIAMGLFAIIHLVISFSSPSQLIAFAANTILIFGLYNMKKWAYIFSIIVSLIAPLLLLSQTTGLALIILILNSIVIIPLLFSTRYFFPPLNKEIN